MREEEGGAAATSAATPLYRSPALHNPPNQSTNHLVVEEKAKT